METIECSKFKNCPIPDTEVSPYPEDDEMIGEATDDNTV